MPARGARKVSKGMPVVYEEHHGREVWTHRSMDEARRSHCLCLNCERMKPGEPDHCVIAQKNFEICKAHDIAMAVTRCPEWTPKRKG